MMLGVKIMTNKCNEHWYTSDYDLAVHGDCPFEHDANGNVINVVNPNYKPGDPPSYRKDKLKPGEPNSKDLGIDGYEYEEDIFEDYTPMKNATAKDLFPNGK